MAASLYIAGSAPERLFLFKPEDSLYGVSELNDGDYALLGRGETVQGCYALVFCCPTRVQINGAL